MRDNLRGLVARIAEMKKLTFIIILASVVLLLGAKPGDKLKKNYPELYDAFIGDWYVLSPTEAGKILYQFSINNDGTITGSLGEIKFDRKTEWSEWCNSSNPGGIYTDYYSRDKRIKGILKSKTTIKAYCFIYSNVLSFNKSSNIKDEGYITINESDISPWKLNERYNKIISHLKYIIFDFNGNYSRGDVSCLAIKDKKVLDDFILAIKEQEIKSGLLTKIPQYYNKGNFGGGYKEFKWGMTKDEVRELANKLDFDISNSSQDPDDLYCKSQDDSFTLTFYDGYLYQVKKNMQLYGETVGVVSKKYGQPKVVVTTGKKSYFLQSGGSHTVPIKYYNYTWSDGITLIEWGYSLYDLLRTDGGYQPHHEYDNGIYYFSKFILDYKKKVEAKKELEEKQKRDKQLQDKL